MNGRHRLPVYVLHFENQRVQQTLAEEKKGVRKETSLADV